MTGAQNETRTMDLSAIADGLAALPVLESVPRKEIEWLLARGEVRTYRVDEVIRTVGDTIDEMNILLEGRVAMHMPRGDAWRKVIEVGAGYVAGAVPYSRMRTTPGRLVVEEETRLLALHRNHFQAMVSECPAITTVLVRRMLDRARDFRTIEMHDERLLALGKLASGLAHELNNPASGASSSARSLAALLDQAERSSRALAAARLSDAQLEAFDAIRTRCASAAPVRGPLEAADREDDFTDWLERHGLDASAAVTLAGTDVRLATLDALEDALPGESLGVVITWITCGLAAREAADQIQSATARIHDLVAAVKGFTFMDREGVPDDVDIGQGLADTIAMLESKARAKSVEIRIETSDDLPHVHGFGSEINEVWERLIDNAIDATATGGSVTITAGRRDDSVVVRVADDGPGIPAENRARVFDPFFTTKPVGQGAGLGLHQARRIVHRHNGDIDFTSRPGRTVFRVRLPVTGARTSTPGKSRNASEA
jgi:signal transduction histidine kinase